MSALVAAAPGVYIREAGAEVIKSARMPQFIVPTIILPPAFYALFALGMGNGDVEMATRIAAHRARREGKWLTIEAPLELAEAVLANAAAARPVLIDCLTLWLSNLMHAGHDCDDAFDQLVEAFEGLVCPIVLVSNP